MAAFHETGYGKRFFESQLPDLITAVKRVADNAGVIASQLAVTNTDLKEGMAKLDAVKVAMYLRECFTRQLDTIAAGIRLKGTLDAKQHEELREVVKQMANNAASVLAFLPE